MPKEIHLASRRTRRPAPLRGMLASTSLLAAATLIALGSAGTSLASWISSDSLNAPVIQSGSMKLLVDGLSGISLTNPALLNMFPGSKASQTVQLQNTGSVKSGVIAATTPAASGVEVRVAHGACPGSIGGASTTTTPTDLGVWNAGQTKPVCVEVSVSGSAPQGASLPFVLTFTATQQAS